MSGAFLLSVGILLFAMCGQIDGQRGPGFGPEPEDYGPGRDDRIGTFQCYEQPPSDVDKLTPREEADSMGLLDKMVVTKCPKVEELVPMSQRSDRGRGRPDWDYPYPEWRVVEQTKCLTITCKYSDGDIYIRNCGDCSFFKRFGGKICRSIAIENATCSDCIGELCNGQIDKDGGTGTGNGNGNGTGTGTGNENGTGNGNDTAGNRSLAPFAMLASMMVGAFLLKMALMG